MTVEEQIRGLALAGIGRAGVEATIGRKMTDSELMAFNRAATARRLKRAKEAQEAARKKREEEAKRVADALAGTDPNWASKLGPKSDAERQRNRRARFYEIGPIPAPADPVRRESTRYDLPRFLMTYCRDILDHEPSPQILVGLVLPLQDAILNGGQVLLMSARGTGKTTIMKGAARWAIGHGHKRFVVGIAATKDLAVDGLFKETVESLGGGDCEEFMLDFPGLAIPIAMLGGNVKGSRTQTVNGKPTGMKFKETRFTLPSVVDDKGEYVEPSHGAVFVACSMGGAIKGLVNKKERPDLFLIDDPQTESVAKSHTQTVEAEKFITGSVLGLAGHLQEPTAVMAITPIRVGDLACRFMDRKLHGEWRMIKMPYVEGWGESHEAIFAGYKAAYEEDVRIGDGQRKLSRQFYLDNRAAFAGLKLVDDKNFTPKEVDAVHHLLNLRIRLKGEFKAECLLDVTSESAGAVLRPDEVEKAVNTYPRFALPPGTYQAVAFCDVNVSEDAGLRYAVGAFGPNRVVAVVHKGRYPEEGVRLYPAGADPETREAAIIKGIKAVVADLMHSSYYCYSTGESVRLRSICFDGGFEMATVDSTLRWIGRNVNMGGTSLYWSRGFAWSKYDNNVTGVQLVKDHIHSAVSVSKDGKRSYSFLAVHADYWKEIAQKAYRIPYPQRGSLSMFGGESAESVALWAEETCNEELIRTYRDEKSLRKAWEWNVIRKGCSHSLDLAYNLLALGHWEGLYTALAPVDPGAAPAAGDGGDAGGSSAAPESSAQSASAGAAPAAAPVLAPRPLKRKPVHHSIFKKCRRSGGGGGRHY